MMLVVSLDRDLDPNYSLDGVKRHASLRGLQFIRGMMMVQQQSHGLLAQKLLQRLGIFSKREVYSRDIYIRYTLQLAGMEG